MILSIMLVALGFLIAMLLALLLAPAFWRRAERLTARRLEQSMPMSIAEAEADRDQIRASYAIIIRRLEAALSQEKMRSARQLVKISRLEMEIADLNDKTHKLRGQLDAEHNAASVLRRTIAARVPELNRAAQDARQLIHVRDREIDTIVNRLRHREEALAIAQRTTEMQQAELSRLRQAMEMSGAQNAGRFKLRPTEWTIHDYRAEYDRLNVELSKLRERLAVAYDREANQVKELRTELQQLADQIVTTASSLPESEPQRAIAQEPSGTDKAGDQRAPQQNTDSVMRSIDAIIADTQGGTRVPAVTESGAPSIYQQRTSRSALTHAATAPGRLARGALQKVAGMAGGRRNTKARAVSGGSRLPEEAAPTPGEVSAARLLGGAGVPGGQPETGQGGRSDAPVTNTTTPQPHSWSSEHIPPKPAEPEADQTTPETVAPGKQSASQSDMPAPDETPAGGSEEGADAGSLYDRYRSAKPASGKLMDDAEESGTPTASNAPTPEASGSATKADNQSAANSTEESERGSANTGDKPAPSGNGAAKPGEADDDETSDTDASPGSLLDRLKQLPEGETR